jgi:pimeloyl-ACP methyl ester carboxylesterase
MQRVVIPMSFRTLHLMEALVTALCFLSMSTANTLPTIARAKSAPFHQKLARDQPASSASMNVLKSHDFELSYRAQSSVDNDPFYSIPAGSADATAGSLLKVEKQTNTSNYTLAPNLSLSRFIYQSKTSNGTLVPVSAYILWPYAARPYHGGYPVVAWAHGTSGNADECAPSNIQNLWHHFQAPYQLALYGYVVVATDYAGLGVSTDAAGKSIIHEYITGPAQANDVYYSIPAARTAFPELSQDFAVVGSSEGGGAAWGFAEKLVREPIAGHLGTVTLSPVTNMLKLPSDGPLLPALMLWLVPTLQTNYPPFKPEDIFTPDGLQSLKTLNELKGCSTVLYQVVKPDILKPGWQNHTAVQRYIEVAANGGKEISGPMLVIQGGADPIIYAPTVEAAVHETVQKFPKSQIEYHLLPNVTHAPAMYAGLQIYVDWITARFAGEPAKPGFHQFTATLARPPSAHQSEANWFIQKQTEPWQVT